MPDRVRPSLEQLRHLARAHGLAQASELSRPALMEWLGPRGVSESAAALQSGRFVRRAAVSAMSSTEDRGPVQAQAPAAGSPTGSGAGGKKPEPLISPPEPVFDLPWSYDDDRLVLLVRDPWTLYTYWDFHPDTVARARQGLAESARPMLRLLDVSRSEPSIDVQVEVDLGWRAYYFHELEPSRDYRVEVVFVDDEGAESPVGRRSNVASLPPDRPSAWVEDRFASIPIDVPLPDASVFAQGRIAATGGATGRLHSRAWELSGGDTMTSSEASSESSVQVGFGGRGWSGSLVRK